VENQEGIVRGSSLILATLFSLGTSGSTTATHPSAAAPTLRVIVDAPHSPGTQVKLRYLQGPDSLQGKTQELVAPTDFLLQGGTLTLLAERAKGHGAVRLRVERIGGDLMGEGIGDRVQIQMWPDSVRVRTLPWWVPI
jgi:hypothetical protein